MRISETTVYDALKKAMPKRGTFMQTHEKPIKHAYIRAMGVVARAIHEATVADQIVHGVDQKSLKRYIGFGAKYANAICTGAVEMEGYEYDYTVKVPVSYSGKRMTREFKVSEGRWDGKPAVSDGAILFNCENPPIWAKDRDFNLVAKDQNKATAIEIVSVPPFDKYLSQDDGINQTIQFSNGAAANPVFVGAVISVVGSPYTFRQKWGDVNNTIFVAGPNGTGAVMPIRVTNPIDIAKLRANLA